MKVETGETTMVAVKGIFDGQKIEFLESPPTQDRSLVAIVFLDAADEELDDLTEASILSQSPTFHRLIEHALEQIKQGQTRPVEALLNEL